MRTIIYVPVIHTSADLGSIAKIATEKGIAGLGEEVWDEHRRTVEGFWDAISDHFDSLDVSGIKIYQDGMVADGEVGQRIVEEVAGAGSRNYELVLRLINKGAVLVKTEDFKLVKEERDRLLAITQATSITRKIMMFMKYKMIKNILLRKRDRFIAKRIDETLGEKETGIVFVGAYHKLKEQLPGDIEVKEIKNTEKVREYQRRLPFCHKSKERFQELGRYLVLKPESE